MKICSGCKAEKLLSEFSRECRVKDGLKSQCKVCDAKEALVYRQSHKAEIAETKRIHNQTPRGKEMHNKRCKKYSLTPKGKASSLRSVNKHNESHPEQMIARNAVNHAITAGKLERPSHCEECGEEKFVCGHHEDYSKLLDVIWVCSGCHTKLHNELILV